MGGSTRTEHGGTVNDRLRRLERDRADDVALVIARAGEADALWSWAALGDASAKAATALAAAGVRAGDRVAVAIPSGVEHVLATHGAWRLGACAVPVRHDLPPWERDRLLEVVAPRVVVADADLALVAPVVDRRALLEPVAISYVAADPDIAVGIASSGSTGRPKLILKPGSGTVSPVDADIEARAESTAAVHLVPGPLYHLNGFTGVHTAALQGARVVLMTSFDPRAAVELIERHQVDSTIMVTTMLQRIARLDDLRQEQLASLRRVLQGGAACPDWLVERWIELVGPTHFFLSYGCTEDVGYTMISGAEWLEHRGSVGRGVDSDVAILDDDGCPVPNGTVGNIYLRPQSSHGATFEYVGADPAPTTADGYTSVGDLGHVDDDGYLFVADRRADLIVTGGANVFPAEVESAISEHPAVADVVVVGLPDHDWGQRVHAVVQTSAPVDTDELVEHCRRRLAPYTVPKSVAIVASLPRTEAGKVNRSAVAAEGRGDV
jgi:bile acid-coenzyme A ligase